MSALILLGAFFALLLAIRHIVLPEVEARQADIAQWLSKRIGQPVEIDQLLTGWDGWNPKLSIRGFRVRDAARGNDVMLALPRVDLLVAWTSVPLLDLRLKELVIDGPRLSLRRDATGRLHIAGIERETDASAGEVAFADWMMRQPQIVIRDALVTWNDDYRRAPQLLLDHVDFRLVQRFGRHHAGLTGVPPPEIAGPLELRVDATGHALNDWSRLEGKLYLRLDYADIAAWREWLPVPVPLDAGKGALRVWADFANSHPTDVTADVELEDVHAKLGEGLAPLSVEHLAGRAQWKRTALRTDVTVRQLTFALPDGAALGPADVALTLEDGRDNQVPSGSMAFDALELRPLSVIAPNLPLPEAVRREIARYEPHGLLENGTVQWTGSVDAPTKYSLKADFRNLGFIAYDRTPGGSNLTGSIDAGERAGQVHLASQSGTLQLPRLFADPLVFETLRGDLSWQRDGDATQFQIKDLAFANTDLAGTAGGTWRSHPRGPGEVDVKAQLTRANVATTHRYLPISVPAAVRDWVKRALVKGSATDARLTLNGDLAQFPFASGKGGQFVFAAKAQETTLQYSDRWPVVTDMVGEVRIDGTHLAITASSAGVLGAQVAATHAEIPDFHDPRPVLKIDGTASGPTTEFLAFIDQTPIREWTRKFSQGVSATGDGTLKLKFDLPLKDPSAVVIDGRYEFRSNNVRLVGVPAMNAVDGALGFTAQTLTVTDLTAEALGGPVKLQLSAETGRIRATAAGTADLQRVRSEYDAGTWLQRVAGRTDWQLALDATDQRTLWSVESSLVGATIDLPLPLGKAAAEKLPLRIERRDVRANEDRIAVNLGPNVRASLHRQLGARGASIDRALVLLGKAASEPGEAEQSGLWVRGDVPALNLDDWFGVEDRTASATSGVSPEALPLNGVDVTAGTLAAFGRTFTRLKSSARRQANDWRVTLDGADLAGTAVWRGPTSTEPNGRIVARLTRLAMPPASDAATAGMPAQLAGANRWPEVDLAADALRSKERTLGKLELLANPSGSDWQIRKLALVNDAGRIDAEGSWRSIASRSQTTLNVVVDVKETGEFLGRFGWPNAVKGAPTKIEGRLSWNGAPSDFDYASLSGTFKLNSGAGQFTKIDPGVGRLLGVLSLQALPRRISLDFRDVFSEGFAFDTIAADVQMQSGVMHTDAFRLMGPAAAVNISGDIDVAHETQKLKIRVQPSLSSGVSVGTAALFLANPLVGAAIGAGTLLAQKMLNNPFDKLFSYEYSVTGSFDDPVVARTNAATAATAAQSGAAVR